jgi:dolichol kinase
MIWTVLSVLIVFCLLVFAEYASRAKRIHAELTRKFVHMSVGTFVAFWPFFLSWGQIKLLSLAFFVVVAVSIKFNIFRSIHAVNRNMVGELLFAMTIGFLTLISGNKWIFMAAMLNLSLADGMAAIIGILKGDSNQYKVFGRTKSRAGTAAFFVTSLLISIFYIAAGPASLTVTVLVIVPLIATLAENVAVHGTDNLVMPLLLALVLTGSA